MNKIQNTTKAVKTHVTKHKTAYLVGGSFAAGVGACALYVYLTKNDVTGDVINGDLNVEDYFNTVSKISGVNYKPTINVSNLVARGHRGYEILCNETGESWASIRRAAEVAGVNPGKMASHLKGESPDIFGKTYTNVGEYMG